MSVAARIPGQVTEATNGLRDGPEARLLGEWTSLTKTRDPDQNEARVQVFENSRAEPPFLETTGSEVLDQDVGGLGQPENDLLGFRIVEVERDGPLSATLDQRPEGPVAADRPSPVPKRIATLRMFDLDHVGAVIRKEPSGEWTRDQGPELKDANTAQRSSR